MPVKGMGVQVPPRTHRDHDLTCGYVIGQSLGKAGCDRFLQVRTMGVQIGFRSRNGNNSNGLQAAAPGRGGRRRAVQVKQRRRHATTVLLVITTRQRPPGPAPRTDTTSSITRTARRTSGRRRVPRDGGQFPRPQAGRGDNPPEAPVGTQKPPSVRDKRYCPNERWHSLVSRVRARRRARPAAPSGPA